MIFEIKDIYGNGSFKIHDDNGVFTFESTLARETCPCCDKIECALDCEQSKAESQESVEDVQQRLLFNLGLDVIESFTGALVVSLQEKGFSLEDENLKSAIKESVETVLDAIANNIS